MENKSCPKVIFCCVRLKWEIQIQNGSRNSSRQRIFQLVGIRSGKGYWAFTPFLGISLHGAFLLFGFGLGIGFGVRGDPGLGLHGDPFWVVPQLVLLKTHLGGKHSLTARASLTQLLCYGCLNATQTDTHKTRSRSTGLRSKQKKKDSGSLLSLIWLIVTADGKLFAARCHMFKTITKAELDDAIKESGTMGDVVFTIQICN